MKDNKNFIEKRQHQRVPVISNIVEPINLSYINETTKTMHQAAAVLADLSASGMRIVSFLDAPVSGDMDITLELPFTGKFTVKAPPEYV